MKNYEIAKIRNISINSITWVLNPHNSRHCALNESVANEVNLSNSIPCFPNGSSVWKNSEPLFLLIFSLNSCWQQGTAKIAFAPSSNPLSSA